MTEEEIRNLRLEAACRGASRRRIPTARSRFSLLSGRRARQDLRPRPRLGASTLKCHVERPAGGPGRPKPAFHLRQITLVLRPNSDQDLLLVRQARRRSHRRDSRIAELPPLPVASTMWKAAGVPRSIQTNSRRAQRRRTGRTSPRDGRFLTLERVGALWNHGTGNPLEAIVNPGDIGRLASGEFWFLPAFRVVCLPV